MTKRNLVVTIIFGLIGIMIVVGFFVSQRQAASRQDSQQAAASSQEKAYENIVKDSLNVYHSRYSHYPKDYQALLDDIAKSKDIYGVNDEGMSELKNINGKLLNFSYAKISDDDYLFTYQDATSGDTITVTNK